MQSLIALTGMSPFVLCYLIAITLLAAVVRGYSGFGFSALVVLLATWVVPPAQIVPCLFLLEVAASVRMLPAVWSHIHWSRLLRLLAGSALTIPIGIYGLAHLKGDQMALIISLLILLASLVNLVGKSFRQYDSSLLDFSTGVVSGLFNGAAAVGGMAVAVVFVSIRLEAAVMRATLVALFFFTDVYAVLLGSAQGLIDSRLLVRTAILLPFLLLGIALGSRRFSQSTESQFRQLTLALLLGLSIVGLLFRLG